MGSAVARLVDTQVGTGRNDCETQGDQAKLWTGAPRSLESFRCCYWIHWAFTKYILTTKLGASSETMTWCGFFMDQV